MFNLNSKENFEVLGSPQCLFRYCGPVRSLLGNFDVIYISAELNIMVHYAAKIKF